MEVLKLNHPILYSHIFQSEICLAPRGVHGYPEPDMVRGAILNLKSEIKGGVEV
jgi:hypothetical protein